MATSWRPTPRPRSCSNARTSKAWTPRTRSPTSRTWPTGTACAAASSACWTATPSCTCPAGAPAPCRAASRRSGWPTARALFLVQVRDRSREHRIELRARDRAGRAARHARGDGRRHPRHRPRRPHPRLQPPLRAHVVAARRRAARGRRPRRARVGAHERDGRRRLRPPAGGRLRAHAVRGASTRSRRSTAPSSSATRSRSGATAGPIGRVFSFRETQPAPPRRAARAGQRGRRPAHAPAQSHRLPRDAGGGAAPERQSAGFAVLCIEFNRDALFGEGGDSAAGARRLSELAGQVRGAMRQPHYCARLGGSRFGVLIDYASEAAAEAAARRLIESQERDGGVPVAIGIGTLAGRRAVGRRDPAPRRDRDAPRAAGQPLVVRRAQVRLRLLAAPARPRRGRPAARRRARAASGSPRSRASTPAPAWPSRSRCTCAGATASWARWRPASSWASPRSAAWSARSTTGCWSTACCSSAAGARPGHPLRLNVNVSDWQLTQPGYARRVAAALEAAGCAPSDLEIDVGESALQADPDAALAAVRSLARQGVRVMLDGFGVGTSSLAVAAAPAVHRREARRRRWRRPAPARAPRRAGCRRWCSSCTRCSWRCTPTAPTPSRSARR